MAVFDASSMIYAWDNYPIEQFPPLWKWLGTQVEEKSIVMPQVAFKSVLDKVPDCGAWLKENGIELLNINNEVVQDAFNIKIMLRIDNDEYHPKGVDEEDLLIIASAKVYSGQLVSNENKQTTLPDIAKKMKIPAVCNLEDVAVDCINFLEYIKYSAAVFN